MYLTYSNVHAEMGIWVLEFNYDEITKVHHNGVQWNRHVLFFKECIRAKQSRLMLAVGSFWHSVLLGATKGDRIIFGNGTKVTVETRKSDI